MFSNNFPNFNVPPPSLLSPEEDVDAKIRLFLKINKLMPETQTNKEPGEPKLNLFEVNRRMNELTQLKSDLHSLYDDLKSSVNILSDEDWNRKTNEIEAIQHKIQSETKFINENLFQIKRLIKKRQNKRKSRKNRKIQFREQLAHEISSRELKHQEIDKKVQQIQEKIYAEKQSEVEKEETRVTLASVQKRIREAKEKLELFESLIKLRQIRKQQSQRSELDVNEESFIEEISRMRSLWTLTLEDYQVEQQKLQEYLDNKFKPQQTLEQQWSEVLFGNCASIPKKIDHPLLRAEKNLNTFLTIRREWDACIVPSSDPTGSSIPVFWVVPPPPHQTIPEWHLYFNK